MPSAGGSKAPPTCGVIEREPPGHDRLANTGTATSRGGPEPSFMATPSPVGSYPSERLRLARHGRVTCGSGRRGLDAGLLPRPERPTVLHPAKTPAEAAIDASTTRAQPQFAIPRKVDQGRCAPVRRQLLPAPPTGRAATADDRHRNELPRVPLCPALTRRPADDLETRRSGTVGATAGRTGVSSTSIVTRAPSGASRSPPSGSG